MINEKKKCSIFSLCTVLSEVVEHQPSIMRPQRPASRATDDDDNILLDVYTDFIVGAKQNHPVYRQAPTSLTEN